MYNAEIMKINVIAYITSKMIQTPINPIQILIIDAEGIIMMLANYERTYNVVYIPITLQMVISAYISLLS